MREIRSKKRIGLTIIILVIVIAVLLIFLQYRHNHNVEFRTTESRFEILQDGEWKEFMIKGVNMGAAKPGAFPGEMMISKEEYSRWFKEIAEMNANTIRVYTILSPDFYEALFEYNLFAKSPIYLFHGVWLNEEAMAEYNDAYASEITDDFENEIKKLIDVLHGNAVIPANPGHASGTYRWDVSPYIVGYILGIELDASFVINTNEKNADITFFDGDYLYTENASPHECWLAQTGDFAISYENDKYGEQKPISWVNWLTTDPLEHSAEPSPEEDAVSVDTEHIMAKDTFRGGLFASYHIYPYYPEFMMYQPEYANYVDDEGKSNPYKAYLLDLRAHHSIPVLVAEFGLPASRGNTHENVITGYNQGFMSEQQQGEYVADMMDSIVSADCAGGLIFTWQDEWFKRSWNTMDYDEADRRPYWSNYQASEQHYGLMSFDPGDKRSICYVDGDITEWADKEAVCQSEGLKLHMMSDEKFVYILIQGDGGKVEETQFVIGIDSISGQGNTIYPELGISFLGAVEYAVIIDGKEQSRILVDAYYDIWYRIYSLLNIIEERESFEQKNSGIFNPINLILNIQLELPLTGEIIPQHSYETGKLLHGNANPDSADYNSLSDFYINPENDSIEMRIPWQLLNVADPSSKKIVGDLYENASFNTNITDIDGFSLEIFTVTNGEVQKHGDGYYSWNMWEEPKYHERLKKSYYIVQDNFAKY